MFRSRRALDQLRHIVTETPDIRKEDAWWPIGDDSEEFKRGARWAENWWRMHIESALAIADDD